MKLVDRLKAARRVSVPLVAISTADPSATVRLWQGEDFATVGVTPTALLGWDVVQGLVALNEAGKSAAAEVLGDGTDSRDLIGVLVALRQAPAGTVVLVKNAHRFISEIVVVQAIWNLRDEFKRNFRMLVLLAPSWELPVELQSDAVVLEHPLPTSEEISERISVVMKSAALKGKPDEHAIDALRGLTAFQSEQQAAMAATKAGINVDALWESKRKLIAQTPGLAIEEVAGGFESIGGVEVAKDFTRRVLTGKRRPKAIVFIDEIEKALAGVAGDSSGTSQDQLGALLSYMQDNRATGMLFIGPPGAAKSAVAKAAGKECGLPTVRLDLGATKGSLVGQSEQQLRTALSVISAVSDGSALWIATCNSIGVLPPELRRRFTLGTYFFDLPDASERAAIWKIYKSRFGLKGTVTNDEGWTGAEIERCCDIADRLGVDLDEAARFVVPVSKSASDQILALRRSASGKFLSASRPGTYLYAEKEAAAAPAEGRSMLL